LLLADRDHLAQTHPSGSGIKRSFSRGIRHSGLARLVQNWARAGQFKGDAVQGIGPIRD
jgi:hypothetical protein